MLIRFRQTEAERQEAGLTEERVEQISKVWNGLETRKRVMLVAAVLATVASMALLATIASAPRMKLLFAGLDGAAAAHVVAALEQKGVEFEVRGNSVYVPAGVRDELRMTLAGEGLPANGEKGYELLDSLSGFGTTSQMFDAAYWRAQEGELARTIMAGRNIARARVHIAHDSSGGFRRDAKPTASVSVVPAIGSISVAQAEAIRHLVSAAVPGMNADDVAVIDANGVLIGQGGEGKAGQQGEERAARLRERVLRLVEARVGPGNAVVEVSVETVTEQRSVRERRIDPDSRVAISKDVEETSDSSTSKPASVTVASNLPDGEASGGGAGSEQASTSRERVNYEISQTEVEVLQQPGDVRRLTVAVLVNGIRSKGPDGSLEFRPRAEEELAALRELVAAAVGFDEARGDVITIRSMEMPAVDLPEMAPSASWFDRLNIDVTQIVQAAALAIVALILGLFVIRPLLLADRRAAEQLTGLPAAIPDDPANALPVLNGEIDDTSDGGMLRETGASQESDVQLPSPRAEDAVDRLRAMIGERQEETVQILRSWLQEEEETA